MHIDRSAFDSLEIDKIFALIRRDCRCDLGASKLASMEPAESLDELEERHALFEAVESYRDERGELPWSYKLCSVAHTIDDAKHTGMMTGDELVSVRRLMQGAARMKDALTEAREKWPPLASLLRSLRSFDEEIGELGGLDEEGRFYDTASDRLRRIREKMRSLRDAIRRKGSAILSDPSLSNMLQERVLSLRHGRHAVLVRQDCLASFPGVVMDRSSSGSSVYMEPHALVAMNNDHALAVEDERAEERRLLHKLTERVLSREAAIADAEDALGTIDLFYALSEKVRRDHWKIPLTTDRAMFSFRRARHPLLGDGAVPIDVSCGETFRSLIITGPNTGGKTVALKTACVCAALAWYGMPIPAGEESRIGAISDIYTDIGDEQSIEQNLSTFSAHIKQIDRIVTDAGPSSLVCLDELGAGTDPAEGAAIGIAVLEWLRQRGSLVLATTHHDPIKHYALTTEGIESASVEFNASTLSPTYRLLVGIPGRSNALLIAERLGLPKEIISRAREALHGREVSMEDIIGELHEKRAAIEHESAALDAEREEIERKRAAYERERRELEEQRDRMIAEADKKALGIVANAERSAKSLMRTIEGEARGAASRKYDRAQKHFGKIKESAEHREEIRLQKSAEPDAVPLEIGESVVVLGTSSRAELEAIEGEVAVIRTGSASVRLPLKMLRRATTDESKQDKKHLRAARKSDITWNISAESSDMVKLSTPRAPTGVPSSIMVRGMTIDEAMPVAERFLDRAFRAGYGEVSIIHGRGEGILRREVHSLCKGLPYVASYRLGEPGEGGHGVTVIRFKPR